MKQEGKRVAKSTRIASDDAHSQLHRKLAPMQVKFVEEYLQDLNATQAAIRAGYSAKSAAETAVKLCQKVQVQRAIQEGIAARALRTGITADRVLLELERMAFFDPADYTKINSPADIKALPEDQRRAIVGWKYDKLGNFTVDFAKVPTLTLLGRHLSMWTDKVEVKVESELADRLKRARERAGKRGAA